MKNKNLIYTICSGKYVALLEMFVKSIRKFNDVDILIITDDNSMVPKILELKCLLFMTTKIDWRHSGKFIFYQYPDYDRYDNFLFLDTDIICKKNLDGLFETIESDKTKFHLVKARESLKGTVRAQDGFNVTKWFRTQDYAPKENSMGYNAGTFGFNKLLFPHILKLHDYLRTNRHKGICDQPIFNVYIDYFELGSPSLSEYLWLDLDVSRNKCTLDSSSLVHFVKGYGAVEYKEEKMKKLYDKIII
jgi:hypothetical protein